MAHFEFQKIFQCTMTSAVLTVFLRHHLKQTLIHFLTQETVGTLSHLKSITGKKTFWSFPFYVLP